jgi:hypothetical protein
LELFNQQDGSENAAEEMQRGGKMLTETIPRFAPAFDVVRERDVRRQGVLDADKSLSVAVEALKTFQGDHYALDAHGRLVPKVTIDAVSNEAVDLKHQQLVREVSACHDRFQAALKFWNQL